MTDCYCLRVFCTINLILAPELLHQMSVIQPQKVLAHFTEDYTVNDTDFIVQKKLKTQVLKKVTCDKLLKDMR